MFEKKTAEAVQNFQENLRVILDVDPRLVTQLVHAHATATLAAESAQGMGRFYKDMLEAVAEQVAIKIVSSTQEGS